jgi:hypothetical protein
LLIWQVVYLLRKTNHSAFTGDPGWCAKDRPSLFRYMCGKYPLSDILTPHVQIIESSTFLQVCHHYVSERICYETCCSARWYLILSSFC